ncbi:CDP-diacylglycerol--serine O-phosphatidyltransferase [bacterium]|nr:CDP-diacylglycerol--serine O-phosphatidyltransferase [bacterium]MCP5462865.1 CDP-diacylglycerol--serine O-phosphatidyltransferase [bacterium]
MKRIALLPNIITGLNFTFGIFSLMLTYDGEYVFASLCIFLAMLFDFLDGQVARRHNATSQFGIEFDSLSDLLSFGIAPGMLVFASSLHSLNEFGIVISICYMLACGIRLARFNSETNTASSGTKVFIGLPSPASAGMVCSSLILLIKYNNPILIKLFPFTILFVSFLMVSKVKYPVPIGFIFFLKSKIVGIYRLAFVAAAAFLLLLYTEILIFNVFAIYMLFGLTRRIFIRTSVHAPQRLFIFSKLRQHRHTHKN